MTSRAPSRRGAAPAAHQRRASAIAARAKSGRLRRIGRIALCGVIGFMIGSIVLVALYRVLPPPGTPLMLLRLVEGYDIDKSWRPLDDISPHLIRAVMAGEDTRFCRHRGFDWGAIAQPGIATRAAMAACSGPVSSRCRPQRMSFCGPAATGCAKDSKPGSRR